MQGNFVGISANKLCMNNLKTTEYTESTEQDPLTAKVIGCAIEVHRHLGPGLLESSYEQCLAYEMDLRGIEFQVQVPQSITKR